MADTDTNRQEPTNSLNPINPLNPMKPEESPKPAKSPSRRGEALAEYVQTLERENAKRKAENEALVAEFRETVTEEWSADDVKKKIRDLMEIAYSRMAYLIVEAENEAVQAALIKYVFNIGIGVIKITDDNDTNKEFKELLTAIKKSDPSTTKSNSETKGT